VSSGDGIRPESIARVIVRPLGTVLPLGFLAFAAGAFVTAVYSLGWIDLSEGKHVNTLLLIFVVPLQGVAAIFAFLSRDTAGGTSLGLFAGIWAAVAVTNLGLPPGGTSQALGVFLLAVCGIIVALGSAAVVGNPAFAVIMLVGLGRFGLNGLFELTGNVGIERAAGWIGLVLSAVAGYAGLAFLLEDARHESVLPFMRQRAARDALDADLADQLRRLEREPGVRARL
jgi:uncharacterized protein